MPKRCIINGMTMPKNLRTFLEEQGMPKTCVGFRVECEKPNAPVIVTFSHAAEDKENEV